jgi:Short C-terminal domain
VVPVGSGGSGSRGSGSGGSGSGGSWAEDTPPSGIDPVPRIHLGEDTVADRLVQLDELRRRGIVTDEEFASKKAELLARL